MKRIAIAVLSLGLLVGAGETSWNWFGGSTVEGASYWSFFELNGVKQMPGGIVQVWTKTIAQSKMDDQKPDNAITSQAANRLAHHYLPIVARSKKYNGAELTSMIIYEAIANSDLVPPKMQLLFEIDCKADMDRVLSIHMREGEKLTSRENPQGWEHIVPETNAARLKNAVCK